MEPHTVGIVAALSQEARSLSSRLPEPGAIGRIGEQVLIAVSGIGPSRARLAARALVSEGASALMSWGVAAALVPELKSGTVLLPRSVFAADGVSMPVDAAWHDRMFKTGSFDVRPIAQARSVLTPADKRALAEQLPAVAADMESAAVARVAQESRVPFAIVRAIADEADMPVPGWLINCMDEEGRIQILAMGSQLFRNPFDATALMRLARAFTKARAALTRFRMQHLRPPLRA
jgi:adenosylhomocysteine nucleosidase